MACTAAATLLLAGSAPHAASRPQPPPAPRVVVSLTFNDGHVSQYDYARDALAARGMPATFYLVSRWIDERWPCCMTWWQVDELYRAGHEIGGMGLEHEDLTMSGPDWREDQARKRRQVCEDRMRLADRGYDPISFAYPGGAFATAFPDASTPQDIVRGCGYLSARAVGGLGPSTGKHANPLPPPDPHGIRTPDRRDAGPIQLADLTGPVTAAAQRGGGWVPLVFDRICHAGSDDYDACMSSPRSVPDTTLTAFLGWLARAGRAGGAPLGTVVATVRAAFSARAQPPLPVRPTIVSLVFDDGSRSQYVVRSALLDRGMRASFYINTSLVDRADGSAMTWWQLRQLAADGNDIGGHTLTHRDLLGLSDSEQRHEVCDDRDRLVDNGIDAAGFTYPYGLFDAQVQRVVQSCGYRWARLSGGISPEGPIPAAVVPPSDRYATPVLSGDKDGPIELSELESAVRTAAARGGGWLPIVFHQVCRMSERDFDSCMRSHRPVDLAVLGGFLDWLHAGAPPGVEVKTVRTVMESA